MTLVARALLPVGVLHAQECPCYRSLLCQMLSPTPSLYQMKFQLSPAPAALPHSRTKLQSRDVAVASVPPGSFLRAYGSKDGGSEATATVSWTIACPIQF